MLVGRRDHLVLRAEAETGEHDLAAVRGRGCQCELRRLRSDERCERPTNELAQLEGSSEVRHPAAALPQIAIELGRHRFARGLRQRPERPGVEIRDPLEHREQRARLLEGHPALHSAGCRLAARRHSARAGPRPRQTGGHQGDVPKLETMHVLLADPPAYTPPYDHALASALARAGVDVTLLTSRFRFGEVPRGTGYEFDESLYRRSTGIGPVRARLAVKALEHPSALARLAAARPDILHLQWVSAPVVDAWLLRPRAPVVFTAHDLLPRRTARRARTWRRLFDRFDRVVTHSERGRRTLVEFGVDEQKLRVIHHPVFRSDPPRTDDGRTVLALGVIQAYKGLPDLVDAIGRTSSARLLVAGDPRIPVDDLRAAAGERAEWRLGFLSAGELERALGASTVAAFPYRAELDQSGALLQAIGAGVPAVVYDVGGLGEVVSSFAAGRVVPAGDVAGFAAALDELLQDEDALANARAGAAAARDALTWDRAAAAHLAVYEELA